jgi:hypothetical protein
VAEQRTLARAQAKIDRIRRDLVRAKGLTSEEAKVAAKAGLIDPDQKYWWTEAWQKSERVAETDARAGRLSTIALPSASKATRISFSPLPGRVGVRTKNKRPAGVASPAGTPED